MLVIFCIFVHKYFFIVAILIISFFAFNEISAIITRIKNYSELVKLFLRFTSFFYLFGIFALSSIGLYFINGPFFFLYILCICISSDIGGYIVGKNIGGKKLTKISPNKTISGSLGSFFFSAVPILIFYNINSSEYLLSINNFLICLFISFVCQLGDLFVSYLKRRAKVKDTGSILPGHGGLLDRVDGIIFAIPVAYILFKIISL